MDIQVDITERFDKEFKKLSQPNQNRVKERMNVLISELRIGNSRNLYRTKTLAFPDGIQRNKSSLYLFKATPAYRVVLSLDEDKINDQKVLTLYSISHHDKINVCFMAIATKLYDNGK